MGLTYFLTKLAAPALTQMSTHTCVHAAGMQCMPTCVHGLQQPCHGAALLHPVVTLGLQGSAFAQTLQQLPLTSGKLRARQGRWGAGGGGVTYRDVGAWRRQCWRRCWSLTINRDMHTKHQAHPYHSSRCWRIASFPCEEKQKNQQSGVN